MILAILLFVLLIAYAVLLGYADELAERRDTELPDGWVDVPPTGTAGTKR